MKSFTVLSLSVILLAKIAQADTLLLQGVVPDRGIIVKQNANGAEQIVLQEGSELKVSVAPYPSDFSTRSPQSVTDNAKNWKSVSGQKTINSSAYIRVEAP